MKASLHLGSGKSLHNDRDFDLAKADHIHIDKQNLNRYIICSENAEDRQMAFKDWELKFYENLFSQSLNQTNANYIAQRHPERIKTMSDWVTATYKPTEAIIQLGNKDEQINPTLLNKAFLATLTELNIRYPQVKSLDIALHLDETTPHIHYRFVIVGHDKYGNDKPLKTQGLKEMGIERPDMLKPEGRYNNPLMTFTGEIRDILYAQIEKLGLELDREPRLECQHLDVLSYKKKQTINDIGKISIELEKKNNDLDDIKEELRVTEETIQAKQQLLKTAPHILTRREIERLERYYQSNLFTGKVSIPEKEFVSLIATKKVADNISVLQEELTKERNKYVMAQRRLEADREDVLEQAREEGIKQGINEAQQIRVKASCFDQFIELLKHDIQLKESLRRAMEASVKRYPQLTEALSKVFDWASDIRNKLTKTITW